MAHLKSFWKTESGVVKQCYDKNENCKWDIFVNFKEYGLIDHNVRSFLKFGGGRNNIICIKQFFLQITLCCIPPLLRCFLA